MNEDMTLKRELTPEEMLSLAIISMATPLIGYAAGGKSGALAGGASGTKAAAGYLGDVSERQREDEKLARASELKDEERAERLEDSKELEKFKAGLKEPKTAGVKPVKNALGQVIDANTKEVIDPNKTPSKPVKAAAPKESKPKDPAKGEDVLRKELTSHPITKRTMELEQAYGSMKNAKPNAAGDLSLIFQYMKMLDPGSVVREGEFANAQNAAGVPDRVVNAYNNALKGERLNEDQRKSFLDQAEAIVDAARKDQQAIEKNYEGIAKRRGADPQNVIVSPYREKAPEITAQDQAALDWATEESKKPADQQDKRLQGVTDKLKTKGLWK